MARKAKNISITASVKDSASGPIAKLSGEVRKAAEAQVVAEGKLIRLHRDSAEAMQSTLSPAQRVAAAIRAQTAAGNPLASRLASLKNRHQELTAALRAEAKSGKELSASMVKQAAAAQSSIEKTKAKIRAESQSAKATRDASSASNDSVVSLNAVKIAAVAAATAFGALLAKSIMAADNIGKASSKLGVAAQDLQVYRKMASDAGVSSQQLDNSIRALTRRAADAAAGNQEFAKGFARLGVDVMTADGRLKTVSELMPEMADGFKGLSDGGIRVSAAMATMGDAGAEMLPIMIGGSNALGEAADRAAHLGGVMSEDVVRRSEEATKAWSDLKFAMENAAASEFVIDFVTRLATGWSRATTIVRDAVHEFGEFRNIQIIGAKTDKDRLAALEELRDAHLRVSQTATATEDEKVAAVRVAAAANAQITALRLGAERRAEESAAAIKAASERKAAADALALAKETEKKKLDARRDALRDAAEEEREFKAEVRRLDAEYERDLKASLARMNAALMRGHNAAYGSYRKQLDNEMRVLELRNSDELAAKEELNRRKAESDKQLAKSEAAMISATNTVAAQSQQMFASMIDGSKSAAEAFEDMAARMLLLAAQEGLKIIMIEAAKAAATAFRVHQSLGPGIGLAIGAAAAATAYGATAAYAQKFADGGIVQGGTEGRDSVLTLSMPGEEFIKASTARKFRRENGQTIGQALEGGGLGGTTNIYQQPAKHSLVVQTVLPPGRRQIRELARMVNHELMTARARGAAV